MQRIVRLISLYSALLLFVLSCDQVGQNERWKSEKEGDLDSEKRTTVLVEEYTGQKCINCPSAAVELAKITQEYPKNVIVVAMHALKTGQALEQLATAEANTYADEYGIPNSVPGIMINRKSFSTEGNYMQKKALWSTFIQEAVNTEARYRIQLEATSVLAGKINVKIATTVLDKKQSSKQLGLQLWLVEDIIAEQALPREKKEDYLHHNVLRGALNGVHGSEYTLGETYEKTFDISEKEVKVDNAKVVAFLYDRQSKQIYETSIVALGKGLDTEKPKEEDKDTEVKENKFISFLCDDKAVKSGEEVKATKIEARSFQGNEWEVVTPIINIIPADNQKNKKYTVEITKQDHLGKENGGFSQVCIAGQCQTPESTEKIIKKGIELNKEDFVQLHYSIANKLQESEANYKVRISIKDGDEEVASLQLLFVYNPKNRPEKEPVKPEPVPTPDNPSNSDDSVTPTPTDPDTTPPSPVQPEEPQSNGKSNVVAFDFTGQLCPACPYAIEGLAKLDEKYKSNLIVIAIQVRGYCRDASWLSYRGSLYENFYTGIVKGYPSVVYNNDKKSYFYPAFISKLEPYIEKKPLLKSLLKAQRSEKNVKFSFSSKSFDNSDLKGRKLNVLFLVTENNLKGYQARRGYNYTHNHILRGGFDNKLWGQEYELGSTVDLDKQLPEKVKVAGNCDLIAIVLDRETKEFLDAVKVKL